ncbi:putative DNA-binding transcriptional regulator YafY [Kaistia hirudinis]|uniref:Putative DNA-binding transcriptional regulator YafY n=1 Tax=Kaistia hirudinis TaxID=1293440 RepID=A0A840AWS0_9HYPH|nr:YafY family protein [Kaistia hirudinis]MBB3933588.1 putative DNA-binding transcriptional regulator YafY [Kaistia hirudinis]
MSRSERLLTLLQALRRHRLPVSGRALAEELGVSVRTLYRDVATLQAQGADIQGEAGVGYVLKPGFMLPPLMFSEEEIEAFVLGMRFVASHGDAALRHAAEGVLAKVATVLPADLKAGLDGSTLLASGLKQTGERIDLALVRKAIRTERKLTIAYADGVGQASERTIWPFALGFFEKVRVLVAWCELRQDFRHFRTDRIERFTILDERYPSRRAGLLKTWREKEGIQHHADRN